MIVFHGGLTEKEAGLIAKGKYKIYSKISIPKLIIPNEKNTFAYCDPNTTYHSEKDLKRVIRDDMYKQQYIFFFRYLESALEFCGYDRKYILVADISEEILDDYIGVGVYGFRKDKYKIEYRVPGNIVIPNSVVRVVPYTSTLDLNILHLRYGNACMRNANESAEALELMKQKQLTLQDYKKYLSR